MADRPKHLPNAVAVAKRLGLSLSDSSSSSGSNSMKTELIGLFLVGSRLWGNAGHDSDYDFIAVVREQAKNLPSKRSAHAGTDVDAVVYSLDEFRRCIDDHDVECLLVLWLPQESVWLDDGVVETIRVEFVVDKTKLVDAIEALSQRDWDVAKKHGQKNAMDKARRVVAHTLRMATLMLQVARNGMIVDYTACIERDAELKYGFDIADFTELEQRFRPICDALLVELRAERDEAEFR